MANTDTDAGTAARPVGKVNKVAVGLLIAAACLPVACGDDDESTTTVADAVAAADERAVLSAAKQAHAQALEGDAPVDGTLPNDLLGPYAGTPSDSAETATSQRGFATFTDETGALSLEAPADWQSWSRRSPTLDNGPGMIVSDGNPQVFHGQEYELTIDGVNFIASAALAQRLGITDSSARGQLAMTNWLTEAIGFFDGACGEYGGVSIYERGEYYGLSRLWKDCGGHGKTIKDVAALPADGSYVLYIQLTYRPADQELADRVFNTFSVDESALKGG